MDDIEVVSHSRSFGQSLKWTRVSGIEILEVSGCASSQEAKRKCLEHAHKHGWTPPQWWECSRWGDTRVDERNGRLVYRVGLLRPMTRDGLVCIALGLIVGEVTRSQRFCPLCHLLAVGLGFFGLLLVHHSETVEKRLEELE